jgi:hypothetical protein
MPQVVEECVKKISGKNNRTGKPYTKSEKWAICTAQHKKSKAELNLEDISNLVANATYNYAAQLYKTKRAGTMTDAYELAQVALAKSGYNYEVLEMVVNK